MHGFGNESTPSCPHMNRMWHFTGRKKTHLEKPKSIIHVNKCNKSISLRFHDTNIFRRAPAARLENDVSMPKNLANLSGDEWHETTNLKWGTSRAHPSRGGDRHKNAIVQNSGADDSERFSVAVLRHGQLAVGVHTTAGSTPPRPLSSLHVSSLLGISCLHRRMSYRLHLVGFESRPVGCFLASPRPCLRTEAMVYAQAN